MAALAAAAGAAARPVAAEAAGAAALLPLPAARAARTARAPRARRAAAARRPLAHTEAPAVSPGLEINLYFLVRRNRAVTCCQVSSASLFHYLVVCYIFHLCMVLHPK